MTPPMTVENVAEFLSLRPATVCRMIREGVIVGVKAGKSWRVTKESLDEYLNKTEEKWKIHKYSDSGVRARQFYRMYGITLEQREETYEMQKGRCAICKKSHESNELFADHDHKTEIFRGLLCRKCNTGLGFFEDDIERLESAADYLSTETFNEEKVQSNDTSNSTSI
jgi:excisionase family DNA binding protein